MGDRMSAKLISLDMYRETGDLEAAEFIQRQAPRFNTGFPLLDACLSWNSGFSDLVLETLNVASRNTHGGTQDEPL